MKTVFLSLLIAATVLTGSGCIFMSDEDRDFYGKGWVRPADLDRPAPRHTIPDPSRPQQTAAVAPAQTSSADADPQWLVPEQAPH